MLGLQGRDWLMVAIVSGLGAPLARLSLVVVVALLSLSCRSSKESPTDSDVLTIDPDSVRVLSDDEVRNNVYFRYAVGIHELEFVSLRQALCPRYASDESIDSMIEVLRTFSKEDRFRSLESSTDPGSNTISASVELGDLAGEFTITVTPSRPRCIDSVAVSDEQLARFLVPGATS